MKNRLAYLILMAMSALCLWAEPAAECRKSSTKVDVVSTHEYYATYHREVVIHKESKSYLASFATTL